MALSDDSDHLELSAIISSGDFLDVRQFKVHERMSALFTVSLVVLSENPNIELDAVVGCPARFSIRRGPRERSWSGLCDRFEHVAVEEQGLSTYHLTLAPTLWLTTQRQNHRVFQQVSEPEIALDLLAEWGIHPDRQLRDTYKKRKYRVQYAESDFAFVSRMLEDAGISYYFDQQGAETNLVLCDAPQTRAPRPAKLPFRDNLTDKLNAIEHVTAVRMGKQVRPGRYTMRDHDYRLPADYALLATAATGEGGREAALEQFHYTPGAFLFRTDKGDDTPVADDLGKTRTDASEASALAQKRLDARREGAVVCTFESNALDLQPGVVMSILDHPRADLAEDQQLLIVESTVSGTRTNATVTCEARKASLQYRPPLVTPKPKVVGVESATVVGPKGEEIHTDEFGRVRVSFHWDRLSKHDETSSCWIHVSHPWAGAGYGGTNLPRIGQEVLVDFLSGDPDRPIITGRVYTNLQKTPYKLPDNKTQSGWKSSSSPATGGYNEIMFEDKAGQELVRVQAEKDLHKLVKNNEEIVIGASQSTQIGVSQSTMIGMSRSTEIGASDQLMVGVSRSIQVGETDSTVVGNTHSVVIPGDSKSTSTVHKPDKITLETASGAKIEMDGPNITLSGVRILLAGEETVHLEAPGTTNLIKLP